MPTIQTLISQFLQTQLDKKLEPERKKKNKLTQESDPKEREEIEAAITKLKNQYALDNWMDDAANRMASQLKFGTHTSKGIHPDSKGDNVNFRFAPELDGSLVGSQTLETLQLDANGNAAALPLAGFLGIVVDEEKQTRLRDLILSDAPELTGVFASDPGKSDDYQQKLKAALESSLDKPVTNERNKQLLWPMSDTAVEDGYIATIPLYPSALASALQRKINDARYSEANKAAREQRKKAKGEQMSYVSLPDLAKVKLGGTKPQNISQLNSLQGGRHYLMPSLPPLFERRGFAITKNTKTMFTARLYYYCRVGFSELSGVVKAEKNVVEVRDRRKIDALDSILAEILSIAAHLQTQPAGWTKDYKLSWPEKYWLDPGRKDLPNEEAFAEQWEKAEWVDSIQSAFAAWVNNWLSKRFKNQRDEFGDADYLEWKREMEQAIRASQRNGLTVFKGVWL